jgi:hypothetical protein
MPAEPAVAPEAKLVLVALSGVVVVAFTVGDELTCLPIMSRLLKWLPSGAQVAWRARRVSSNA